MTGSLSSEDFDAAKAVFEQLKDLPRDRQERVLRWISEGIGIHLVGAAVQVGAAPPQTENATAGMQTEARTHLHQHVAAAQDIKSFVGDKAPKSDNQFAAVVAYYYRFEAPAAQRKDSIDSAVLQEAARLAGRKRLAQPRYALNNAKNAGYLDSAGRGQFAINSVGENLVAMALPGDGVVGGGVKPTKAAKKRSSRKAAVKRGAKSRRGAKR